MESGARQEQVATGSLERDVVAVHTLPFSTRSYETLQTMTTDVAYAWPTLIASHSEYVWDDDHQRSLPIAATLLAEKWM